MPRFRPTKLLATALALPLLFSLAGGCSLSDDEVEYNQLERLRVLGIRSEPADVAAGETAQLSALVFEPEGRRVRYAWSWCPLRGGAEDGFRCLVDQAELRTLWQATGSSAELPPYDLGTGQTAELPIVFDEDLLAILCAALFADEATDERLLLACVLGFEPSIQLTVTTSEDEVVAIRTLPLADADDPEARNHNPELNGEIELEHASDASVLEPDEPLRADTLYRVRVGVDPSQAERFLPEPEPGLSAPEARRETLVMTWFVAPGSTDADDERRGPGADDESTSYADGGTFDDLLENGWQLPATLHTRQGRLILVLRDERGGVGWAEHRFTLERGE